MPTNSFLAAATYDGAVHEVEISPNPSKDTILTLGKSQTLLPKQRIPVSKLVWAQTERSLALTIARSGSLTVSVQSGLAVAPVIVSCRHDNISPVTAILPSLNQNDRDLDIILVAQLLPILKFRLSPCDPIYNLESLGPDSRLVDFLREKLSLHTIPGTKSFIKIYGAIALYGNAILSFFYEYVLHHVL